MESFKITECNNCICVPMCKCKSKLELLKNCSIVWSKVYEIVDKLKSNDEVKVHFDSVDRAFFVSSLRSDPIGYSFVFNEIFEKG